MTLPLIQCKNICKSFGKGEARVEALRGVDLEIPPGQLRLLMGPSGSGKTTLVSVIAGILSQDAGECFVNNIEINSLSDRERTRFRKEHIGFVFQSFNLIPTLTNEENVSVPLILNGIPREEAITRARALLGEMEMRDKAPYLPKDLSGGQQQRIAIARAMVHEPKIIVCDEPTSFLDHATGNKIMELLKDLVRRKKVTLIVVTHDPRITKFADKIDRLEDGKIVNEDHKS